MVPSAPPIALTAIETGRGGKMNHVLHRITTAMLMSVVSMFFLNACQSIPKLPALPTPITTPLPTIKAIETENIERLGEITRLVVKEAGPLAGLAFTPGASSLLAVYAQEGVLRDWRLADGTLQRTLDVRPIEFGAVSFDAARKLLATGAGVNWESHKLDDKYLGIRIWDVTTGKLIARYDETYHPTSGLLTRNLVPSLVLTPDGTWVLMVIASASDVLAGLKQISQIGVTTGQPGDAFVNFGRQREEDDFDVVAFDAAGEFFAAADEMGQVSIFKFRPPKHPLGDRLRQAVIESPRRLGPKPLALAFDAQRRWLAGVRGNELIVWDLQSFGYPRQIATQVGDKSGATASLAFHPNSNLLAVGTSHGWQIWDVKEKKLVARGGESPVFAVTFSPDGRLFVWGDFSGIVHLWGVSSK